VYHAIRYAHVHCDSVNIHLEAKSMLYFKSWVRQQFSLPSAVCHSVDITLLLFH